MDSGEEYVTHITFQDPRMLKITWRSEDATGVYKYLGRGKGIATIDLIYQLCKLKALPWQLDTSLNLVN